MSTLLELAERCEKATGPDREIDGAIALSLGWTLQKMKGDSRAYYRKPGVTEYYDRSEPPRYTASIDAVLTIAPPFDRLSFERTGDTWGCFFDAIDTNAVTQVGSLLSAVLRARAAIQSQGASHGD